MTRQTDGKSLYEQQEQQILAQSDAFISLLTKRGILGDHKIDNDKIRKAQQELSQHSTSSAALSKYCLVVGMFADGYCQRA